MKLILLLVSTAISFSILAQDTTQTSHLIKKDTVKKTSVSNYQKIQIGINFSPDYCYRTLKNNDGSESSAGVVASRNGKETGKYGYTAGINIIYNFNKNVGISTGIAYSNKGCQTIKSALTYGDMLSVNFGAGPTPPKPLEGKFVYSDYYLDIPLKANFNFGKRKIRFTTSTGFVTNIFIKEKVTYVYDYSNGAKYEQLVNQTNKLNAINISPMVSIGTEWKLSSRNSLIIEPTFRYGALKIINEPVSAYLWSMGINMSYYFGVK